ncbi:MAG: LacI family DNA-binding transcriptional regulator [Rikenellaceae bacterium]
MPIRKKTSIYDIAAELNVSASTVSRALHDHPAISEAMKEKVRAKVLEMNYHPNHAAVTLKTGRVNTIAIVVPSINRNFFASVIEGVEDVVYKLGYDLMICKSSDNYKKEVQLIEKLSRGKVDGIIASLAAETTDFSHYQNIISSKIPLVLFDRWTPLEGAGKVVSDDKHASYMATKHLVDTGRRRIFHFAGDSNVSVWNDRKSGYLEAMRDYRIEVGKDWIYTDTPCEQSGVEFAKKILAMKPEDRPDAIYSTGDYAAKGLLEELTRNDVRVPEDIAIVGYSNEPIDVLLRPTMTSVEQYGHKMGKAAAKMVIDAICGEPMSEHIIKSRLIIRESSMK